MLQQYVDPEHQDRQAGFEEAEEPEIKLPTFAGSWRKQGNSRASLTRLKPLTMRITANCRKFLKG